MKSQAHVLLHKDYDYFHQPSEINFWIPLVNFRTPAIFVTFNPQEVVLYILISQMLTSFTRFYSQASGFQFYKVSLDASLTFATSGKSRMQVNRLLPPTLGDQLLDSSGQLLNFNNFCYCCS